MKLFILIAGFFVALLVERRGVHNVVRERLIRFGVPAVAAIVLLNPISNFFYYITHVQSASLTEFASNVPAYNRAGFSWGEHSPIFMSWHLHIWFILTILVFCLGTSVALRAEESRVFRAWRDQVLRLEQRRGLGALSLALTLAILAVTMRTAHFATTQQMLGGGPFNFLAQNCWLYAPYFLLGIAAYRSQPLFSILNKVRWIEVAAALALLIIARPLQSLAVSHFGFVAGEIVEYFAQGIAGTYVIILLFAMFKRFAHQGNPVSRFLADASYTIYIWQMLVLSVIQYLLMRAGLSNVANYFISIVAAYGLLILLHRNLIDTHPALQLLFNGKPWWKVDARRSATAE